MRRSWCETVVGCMVCMLLMVSSGCGVEARIVSPLDRQDILRGQALALLLTRVDPDPAPVAPDDEAPAECLCGGTGRSGDGLGPCACANGCKCKTKTAMSEQTEPETEGPGFVESTGNELQREVDTLANEQSQLSTQVAGHEDRLKALEAQFAAGAKPETDKATGFTEEQATTKRPVVQVVCVSRLGCGPCVQQHGALERLTASGWRIGDETDAHIIKVMNTDASQSSMIQTAQRIARRTGYPTLGFFVDGKLHSAITGFMTENAIADRANVIVRAIPKAAAPESTDDGDADSKLSGDQSAVSPCCTAPLSLVRQRGDGWLRNRLVSLIPNLARLTIPQTRIVRRVV